MAFQGCESTQREHGRWSHNLPLPSNSPRIVVRRSARSSGLLPPVTRRHRLELRGKRPHDAREGVGHPWLVDPADRTLEAFGLRERQ